MSSGQANVFCKTPPNFFVLSKFPNSSAGPLVSMVPESELHLADNPREWYGLPYRKIISLRGNVLCGLDKVNLRNPAEFSSRFEELRFSQMAQTPFDMELTFKSLSRAMRYSDYHNPLGGTGRLEKFQICENPKIPDKAEKIVGDDLKAVEMIGELSAKGFDNYYITKLLTSGLLGTKGGKKLVPTKWSITATDSTLSKQLTAEVKDFPSVNCIYAGESEFLHNRFVVVFLPGSFEFENFEAWSAGTVWALGAKDYNLTEEYESFYGRPDYATKQAGAYYAVRLAACEKLKEMRRQARVVVMREISPEYNVPVGVWQVRENVREAVKGMKKLGSFAELKAFISSRMKVPFSEYFRESRVLPQKTLGDF